jgi:hypothetical protein
VFVLLQLPTNMTWGMIRDFIDHSIENYEEYDHFLAYFLFGCFVYLAIAE